MLPTCQSRTEDKTETSTRLNSAERRVLVAPTEPRPVAQRPSIVARLRLLVGAAFGLLVGLFAGLALARGTAASCVRTAVCELRPGDGHGCLPEPCPQAPWSWSVMVACLLMGVIAGLIAAALNSQPKRVPSRGG